MKTLVDTARPGESGEVTVTFLLKTHNQEEFVRESLRSAFAQTYAPLDIIISDDCSEDRTFSIVEEEAAAYTGPHRLLIRRNNHNLGLVEHQNCLMELIRSGLVVNADADDIAMPHRVQRLVEIWNRGQVMVMCSNAIIIDEEGRQHGLFKQSHSRWISAADMIRTGRPGAFGAGIAWDRRVFDVFGPLSNRTRNEDGPISFRGALLGLVRYTGEPLLYYRQHDKNMSYWAQMSSAPVPRWIALQQAKLGNREGLYEEWTRLLENRQANGTLGIDYAAARSALAARIGLLSLEKRLLTQRFSARLRTVRENALLIAGLKNWAKFLLLAISPTAYAVMVMQARRVARLIAGMPSSLRGYGRRS